MEDGFTLKDATIGIVGLGLMGGSLAMSLNGKCARLIGSDTHLPTLELALSKGIILHAESDSAILPAQVDVLILATPVSTILHFIQQLPSFTSRPCIVLDIGSTKRDILQAMSALPDNFDPIGGHPICGREKLGLKNAEQNLYKNAPFVMTPLRRTSQKAKSAVKQIISIIGATDVEMTAEDHDRILASTSHLPFLLSSALADSMPQEFAAFIGPGFRSTARLAGTPSHMMMGILKSNRDNLLNALSDFQQHVSEIKTLLEMEDYSTLASVLDRSRSNYQNIAGN